jgi:hypothetical protein
VPKKKDPKAVISEAMAEYRKRLEVGPLATIEDAFEAIKPLQGPVEVGLEGFKFIVASLMSAFPGNGYDRWLPNGSEWPKMEERIRQYWSSQTGSGL